MNGKVSVLILRPMAVSVSISRLEKTSLNLSLEVETLKKKSQSRSWDYKKKVLVSVSNWDSIKENLGLETVNPVSLISEIWQHYANKMWSDLAKLCKIIDWHIQTVQIMPEYREK